MGLCSVEISGNYPAQMGKEKQTGLEEGQNGEVNAWPSIGFALGFDFRILEARGRLFCFASELSTIWDM